MSRQAILGMSFALASAAVLAQMGGTPSTEGVPEGSGTGVRSDGEFIKLDANADGKLSKDETKKDSKLSKNFKSLDVDKDGYLSELEFAAATASSKS